MKVYNYENLNKIFQSCLLLQMALHKLEDCQGSVIFVKEHKARLNNTLKWLEGIVNELTTQLNVEEVEEYVNIILQLESAVNEIKLVK